MAIFNAHHYDPWHPWRTGIMETYPFLRKKSKIKKKKLKVDNQKAIMLLASYWISLQTISQKTMWKCVYISFCHSLAWETGYLAWIRDISWISSKYRSRVIQGLDLQRISEAEIQVSPPARSDPTTPLVFSLVWLCHNIWSINFLSIGDWDYHANRHF